MLSSGGATADEALLNIQEAISLWLEDVVHQGDEIPPPRSIKDVLADPKIATELAAGAVAGPRAGGT